MTRIGGSAPGNIQPTPLSLPKEEKGRSLYHLPEELPPSSHAKLSSAELSKLFLPEEVDLSRIPQDHPLRDTLNMLWLEVALKAVVSGGERAKASLPITPPSEPL